MEFVGKLTADDFRDVRRMSRTKMYWVRLVLANWYGVAFLAVFFVATIAGALRQADPNWGVLGFVWAIVAAIVLWSYYRAKNASTRQLDELNRNLPDRLNLTTEGVKLDGPNGESGFIPWKNFKGWREGKRTILLDKTEDNRVFILPVPSLTDVEREPIRQLLRSQMPSTPI